MHPDLVSLTRKLETRHPEVARAKAAIVFGSFAVGKHRRTSDIDVFCVGDGTRFKDREFDIVWRHPRDIDADRWLGSELASHIAAYGLPLWGDCGWFSHSKPGSTAIEKKANAVGQRLTAVTRLEGRLSESRLRAYLERARLDLQRLDLLVRREPVPATQVLRDAWSPALSERLIEVASGHIRAPRAAVYRLLTAA